MTDGRLFLRRLHNAVQRLGYRPAHDPSVRTALDELEATANSIVSITGSAEISLSDPVTLDGAVIDGAAIEYGGLVGRLRGLSIEVLRLSAPIDADELESLVAHVAGGTPFSSTESVRIDDKPIEVVRLPSSLPRLIAEVRSILASAGPDHVDVAGTVELAGPLIVAAVQDPDRAFVRALGLLVESDPGATAVAGALLAGVTADALGLSPDARGIFGAGALLRDVALLIDDTIDVRDHPSEGAATLLLTGGPGHEVIAAMALEHHVRADGSGYPTIGRSPHPFSRIAAVADAFCDVVSGSASRSGRSGVDAMQVLRASAGTDLDDVVVRAFVAAFGDPLPGSAIRLDGGDVAIVAGDRGRALVVSGSDGTRLAVPEPVDLVDRTVVGAADLDETGLSPAEVFDLIG